eukprot:3289616-Amphidinium_carterae.1
MQIISGYPADVYISLSEVRLDPADSLARKQGILDSQLQVSVTSFGLATACLQGLHRLNSTFTVTDDFMWRAFL